jgi:hypothetical protein
MAWETRHGGRLYYYRGRRVGRRVVKEYLGGEGVGDIAEEMDAERRAARDAEREQERHLLRTFDAAEGLLGALDAIAQTASALALEGAGYHRHHRGEWRKRREARRKV